ncbi:DUF6036 family nucleotidyltransferase [Xanthomonas euvesicatoria]|uniref:DUF6036 family nucleotidyltransferase n=1 Tax=Xanthomonas euvesicatoria TaxID=456327 RepID=UPI00080E845D|nr:DUF6036 family nucleotidyltransferase [Xanthomonas euvesicatoria]
MNREQLLHVLRAADSVAGRVPLLLIGSQAVLGAVESNNPMLARSMEADLAAMTDDPVLADDVAFKISGVLGEGSSFNQTHGFYADGVEVHTAKLAPGWKDRTSTIEFDAYGETVTAMCLGPVDLAASKLLAGRDKDLEFVDALLDEQIVDRADLRDLLETYDPSPDTDRAMDWIEARLAAKP